MENLNINSEKTNISVDVSQRVKIEFTGGNHSEMVQSRAAVHTVMVPYSCFSKKLQTIHRSGGKITNISVPRFQLDLPKVNLAVELDEDTMPTLEEIPEPSSASILEVAISTPNPEKAIVETTAKSKKSKTSTKTSHGFSKKELSAQEKESVAIAEIVALPQPIVEAAPEIILSPVLEAASELVAKISPDQDHKNTAHIVETASEHVVDNTLENEPKEPIVNHFEEAVAVSKVEPKIESSTPSAKSKKPKTSSKSGSGFNKPKSDA